MDNNQIDNIFQQFHREWEPEVPANAWEGIEQRLDNKRKPRGWLFVVWIGVLLGPVALGAVYMYFWPFQLSYERNIDHQITVEKIAILPMLPDTTFRLAMQTDCLLSPDITSNSQLDARPLLRDPELSLIAINTSQQNNSSMPGIPYTLNHNISQHSVLNKTRSNPNISLNSIPVGYINSSDNPWNTHKSVHIGISVQKDAIDLTQNKDSNKKMKLYVGIYPAFTYHHLNPNTSDGVLINKYNRARMLSVQRLTMKGNIGIIGSIGKRWACNIGINGVMGSVPISYEVESDINFKVLEGNNIEQGIWFAPSAPVTSQDVRIHRIAYVGLHAGLEYLLLHNRSLHFLSFGTKVYVPLPEQALVLNEFRNIRPQNSAIPAVQAAYLMEIPLGSSTSLRLGPEVIYPVGKWTYANDVFNLIPYQIGMKLELTWNGSMQN